MEGRVMLKDRKEDLEDRSHFIGGSDARIIMGGDEAALIALWQQKRGEADPPDLSGNLIVQLGLVTEGLNRFWYEANVRAPRDAVPEPQIPPLHCLDGRDPRRPGRGDRGGIRGQIHAAVVVFGS